MIQRLIVLLSLAVFTLAAPALAQPEFPDLGGNPVVDAANILAPAEEEHLNAKLLDFEQRTQRQFAVATVPSLGGYEIEEYGYQLGRKWGLGDEENNDGILLLVAPNDRKLRIEVGYGLEPIIPDGLAFDFIEEMKPYFRDGEFARGIEHGADRIIEHLELPPEEAAAIAAQASAPRGREDIPWGAIVWFVFMFFFFVIPMMGRVRARRYRRSGVAGAVGDVLLWTAINAAMNSGKGSRGGWGGGSSSGGFGGGFGGGGGFSGGGGSFGGGGASGSW